MLTKENITAAIEEFIRLFNAGEYYKACDIYAKDAVIVEDSGKTRTRESIAMLMTKNTAESQITSLGRIITFIEGNTKAMVCEKFRLAEDGDELHSALVFVLRNGRPQVLVDISFN